MHLILIMNHDKGMVTIIMALFSDPGQLKKYLFEHSDMWTNDLFILAHAPYCAKHMNDSENGSLYKEILQRMFESHPYTIPFYYIGYVMNSAQWCSAEACKTLLRSICEDMARLVPWFKSQGIPDADGQVFMDNLQPIMTDYLKNFIANVRTHQKEIGANESVMANYAPIVPYGVSLNKDSMYDMSEEYLDSSFIKEYACIFDNQEMPSGLKRTGELSMIALKNTKDIIENIDELFSWKCPMDMFTAISKCRYNNDTFRYLGYLWLMLQEEKINPDELNIQFKDFSTLKSHALSPLKPDEFKQVFESMCNYKTGDINDMLTTESWSALQEESQEYTDELLKHCIQRKATEDTYDLDALLAEFYTMRYTETNDYTNQFFLAEFPGIKVNSYNYIDDTIMACEINEKYLAIPYVDIAADYKVRMITIDKSGEIKIWNDEEMNDLRILDTDKEKLGKTHLAYPEEV